MAGFEDFEAARRRIMAAPFSQAHFNLRRFMFNWLQETKEATGIKKVDLLNNAIGLACFRRLALDHGLQMLMRDEEGVHEFPVPVRTVRATADDLDYSLAITQQNESLLHWADKEKGLTTTHIVYEGVLMLGALAANPKTKIVIPEFGLKQQLALNLGVSFIDAPPLNPTA